MIEQTKTKPQGTLEFKMNKQIQSFLSSPSINSVEEGKWLFRVTSFECTNSVFNTNDENNSSSITIPSHWLSKSAEKTSDELHKILELRSENDIEQQTEQVRKKGLILIKDYSLSSHANFKTEILEEIKNAIYNDIEDMVYRFHLSHAEITDILDLKYIPTRRADYSIPPGMYEISDINSMLKPLLPKEVKVDISIDDFRIKFNLKNNQT